MKNQELCNICNNLTGNCLFDEKNVRKGNFFCADFRNKLEILIKENLNIKKILKQLPDDVVLMSNCPQIELAASALPQKYCDKFIVFGQRELVEVLMSSNWNYSNMGLSEKIACKSKTIFYSNNKLEKSKGKQCVKIWDCQESILEEF